MVLRVCLSNLLSSGREDLPVSEKTRTSIGLHNTSRQSHWVLTMRWSPGSVYLGDVSFVVSDYSIRRTQACLPLLCLSFAGIWRDGMASLGFLHAPLRIRWGTEGHLLCPLRSRAFQSLLSFYYSCTKKNWGLVHLLTYKFKYIGILSGIWSIIFFFQFFWVEKVLVIGSSRSYTIWYP